MIYIYEFKFLGESEDREYDHEPDEQELDDDLYEWKEDVAANNDPEYAFVDKYNEED